MAYSPDGSTMAIGSNSTVDLWDVATGTLRNRLPGSSRNVAYSPDGATIVSRGWNDTVRLWDVATGTLRNRLTGHFNEIDSVAFSPDGNTIASASGGQTVRLWDVATGTLRNTLTGHTNYVNSVAYSPDGNTIASGSWKTGHLWDVATGTLRNTLTGHTGWVNSVAFSPDGNTIASAGKTVRLWDVETGTLKNTLTGHTAYVNSVAYSPDGNTIASGSGDKTVRLWDVETGTLKNTLTGHTAYVNSVAYSPDGNTIASGSGDKTVRLWNVETGTLKNTLTVHSGSVVSVAFSPDGNTIASGSGDGVRLWDVAIGTLRSRFTGHSGSVESIAYSPDGTKIAIGSQDGTVLLWDRFFVDNVSATVRIAPATVDSPPIGEQVTFNIDITGAQNIRGYQITLQFDATALRYVESINADYLPAGAFAVPTIVEGNAVTLGATSLSGARSGDGTLATFTFEVVEVKASDLTLSDVLLTGSAGVSARPNLENATITEPQKIKEDVNSDGVVNIQDLVLVAANFRATGENVADVNGDGIVNIVDLTLVAGALGEAASAPSVHASVLEHLSTTVVEQWLREARQVNLEDATFQRGILVLEQLLEALTPQETALLANYPNPFNPETWIPYQLAKASDVTLTIYDMRGVVVRELVLGHKPAGIYYNRIRAAHWDGRNAFGEQVASGTYFYTFTAGDFTATRKMLIRK